MTTWKHWRVDPSSKSTAISFTQTCYLQWNGLSFIIGDWWWGTRGPQNIASSVNNNNCVQYCSNDYFFTIIDKRQNRHGCPSLKKLQLLQTKCPDEKESEFSLSLWQTERVERECAKERERWEEMMTTSRWKKMEKDRWIATFLSTSYALSRSSCLIFQFFFLLRFRSLCPKIKSSKNEMKFSHSNNYVENIQWRLKSSQPKLEILLMWGQKWNAEHSQSWCNSPAARLCHRFS